MKVEVNNAQQNEQVDWTKNPQLVINDLGNIVLVHEDQENAHNEFMFVGTIIRTITSSVNLSYYSEKFYKEYYKPFHGSITLSND